MGWVGPVTHRQLLVECEWEDEQWNVPDKKDAYLMQVAFEVRKGNAKYPNRVKLDHLKLAFQRTSDKPQPLPSRETAAAVSKAKWLAFVGKKPKVVVVSPSEMGS